jgi:gas vesicle structural protein
MAMQGSGYLERPAPSGLADVVETILDKGIVVDVYARVSLLGIELITLDARIVVSSVDTYLRFAEATNRLDLDDQGARNPLDLLTEGTGAVIENVASHVVEKKVEGVVDTVSGTAHKVVDTVEDVADAVKDEAGELVDKLRPGS